MELVHGGGNALCRNLFVGHAQDGLAECATLVLIRIIANITIRDLKVHDVIWNVRTSVEVGSGHVIVSHGVCDLNQAVESPASIQVAKQYTVCSISHGGFLYSECFPIQR